MAEFSLELPQIPAAPTNADLATLMAASFAAAQKTHECLEQHRQHTIDRDVVFSSQLKSTNDLVSAQADITAQNCKSIKQLTGSARSISRSVKQIITKVDKVSNKVDTAAVLAKAAKDKVDAVSGDLKDFNKSAWSWVLGIVAAIVVGGVLGIGGLAYQATVNHNSTVKELHGENNTNKH